MAAPIENPRREKQDVCYRVLELYSGIGGMHWALKGGFGLKHESDDLVMKSVRIKGSEMTN